MYIDRPMREYLDDLAAKKPVPGGGSAAALAASTGVSLMLMVANYTVGNPKYKSGELKIADIILKCDKARAELMALIDKDIEEYKRLSEGIKAASGDSEKTEALYKAAALPPFEVCKIAAACLKMCKTLVECGNKNLITDTAIAAILLEGSFLSAKFNVYLNLESVEDMDHIGEIHKILSPLEEELPELKDEILEMCEEVIE